MRPAAAPRRHCHAATCLWLGLLTASCGKGAPAGEPPDVEAIDAPEQLDPACGEPVACNRECKSGNAASCLALGAFYARGDWVARDLDRAKELLAGPCEAGQASACEALAGPDEVERPAQARPLLRKAAAIWKGRCEGQTPDGTACVGLAHAYAWARGVARDLDRAEALSARGLDLLDKECTAKRAASCHRLAVALRQGIGVALDKGRARELLMKACEAGWKESCGALVSDAAHERYEEIDHPSPGPPMARWRTLERVCDAGTASACGSLASELESSHGPGDHEAASAQDLLERACKLGDAYACSKLVPRLAQVDVAESEKRKARARELWSEECDLGDARACGDLAPMLATVDPGKSRSVRRRQVELWRRECDAGEAYSCSTLARAYARGGGVPADLDAAKTLFAKACKLGVDHDCSESVSTEEARFAARRVEDLERVSGKLAAFAADEAALYLAVEPAGGAPCDGQKGSAQILRVPRAGHGTTTAASGICTPVAMTIAAGRLIWLDAGKALSMCDPAHCEPQRLSPAGEALEPPLAASSERTVVFKPPKQLVSFGRPGDPEKPIAEVTAAPAGLATFGDAVAWSDAAARTVWRIAGNEREPTPIAHLESAPGPLAAAGGALFVAEPNSGSTRKLTPETKTLGYRAYGATALLVADGWLYAAKVPHERDILGGFVARGKLDGFGLDQTFYAIDDAPPIGLAADATCVYWGFSTTDGQAGAQKACEAR